MRNKFRVLYILVLLLIVFSRCSVFAQSKISQTEVSKYALSWKDNTKIPYVYGGGRGVGSLEELEKSGGGADCSGFVSLVYKHFGISVTAQSEVMLGEAKKKFTKEEDAIPGDIVYWPGHVGIYVGNGKIVHTNTPAPPTNYPHISIFAGEGVNYSPPVYYLRMVDDIKDLKPLKGEEKKDTEDEVKESAGTGSLLTYSDITGMPIESTLIAQQKAFELKGYDNLSLGEQQTLAYIKDMRLSSEKDTISWFGIIQSVCGIGSIAYGVILFVCYLFDYSNMFIEVSLLSIVTLGRFRIVDSGLAEESGIHLGYSENSHCTRLTLGMLLSRVFVLILVGVFLVSGGVGVVVSWVLNRLV